MGWRQKMRAWWPFGAHNSSPEATLAVRAAEQSRQKAFQDRAQAAEVRVEAEQATEVIRAHNAANRYDDFLRRVVAQRDT